MNWFIDSLFAIGGGAFIWFTKDFITKAVTGTESFITSLRAKASALEADIKK